MPNSQPDKTSEYPIYHLLPNLLTLLAICAGLTAIRFGYQGDFPAAVRLVLIACVLDGLDGRLARLLNCQTPVGAELDSLADFLNFGVAPALIIHAWALQDSHGLGWIAALGYAICCVLRLARFNVSDRLNVDGVKGDFFVGLPSPAGAMLAMLPMYVAFLYPETPMAAPAIIAGYLFFVGLLMISRIPTYSFKNMSIAREYTRYLLLVIMLLVSALLTYLWTTMILITLAYVLFILWSAWLAFKSKT